MPSFNERLQAIAKQVGEALQGHEDDFERVEKQINDNFKNQDDEKSIQDFRDRMCEVEQK